MLAGLLLHSCGPQNNLTGSLANLGGSSGGVRGQDVQAEPSGSEEGESTGSDIDEDIVVEVPVVISGGHLWCDFSQNEAEATCFLSRENSLNPGDIISIEQRSYEVLSVSVESEATEIVLKAAGEDRSHLQNVTRRMEDFLQEGPETDEVDLSGKLEEASRKVPEAKEKIQAAGVSVESTETVTVEANPEQGQEQQQPVTQPVARQMDTCSEGVSYIVSPQGMVHSEAVAWCAVQGGLLYDHRDDSDVYSLMQQNMLKGSYWIASFNGNDYQSSCLALTMDDSGNTVNTLLSCDTDLLSALCECESGND